jgi:hypothetical protein
VLEHGARQHHASDLKAGAWVELRSLEEILAALNKNSCPLDSLSG